jgi:hypothetical protein
MLCALCARHQHVGVIVTGIMAPDPAPEEPGEAPPVEEPAGDEPEPEDAA